MSEKKHVTVREFVQDIRSGMLDQQLMERYNLSAKGLQRAFQKLVEMKAMSPAEIDSRGQPAEDTIFFNSMREIPRNYLVVPVKIQDLDGNPRTVGTVRDITEKGLGITGIQAEIGESKTFAFVADEFVTVGPFSFKAVCRWMERGRPEGSVGGFEITEISADDMDKLRQMIEDLTFGDG
jgi:hypothetical protein